MKRSYVISIISSLALISGTAVFLFSSSSILFSPALPKVKEVDMKKIDPESFSVDEWFVPYYLKNFSAVANSVIDSGENKGFIDIVVWRSAKDNKPYNARIMESILSLAWFYTHQRPWNVYYADPSLRQRLEAALTFWCDIQHEDGRFSEYAPQQWSLAPTAFATKFVGRALYLLKDGPPIDPNVLERTRECMRKALYVTFTNPGLWEHGKNYTNQYENAWGGALLYLEKFPDTELENLFHKRLNESIKDFQSPCGYFYEKNGPDWGYNLSTHHSDLHVAWHYVKGKPLEKIFLDKTEKWYDWFSYNAVQEPQSTVYYLNKAVETRQQRWMIKTDSLENPSAHRWAPQAELVPVARAFSLSREEYARASQLYYAQMKSSYPAVGDLRRGEFSGFSPYAFLHNELINWLPSEAEKQQAVSNLPYLKNNNFIEVRRDNRNNTSHAFVRKPKYYAIFNEGTILTPSQRFGLGLIWNPSLGAIMQSQSNSDVAAWGTKALHAAQVYEASDIAARYLSNAKEWKPAEGSNPLTGDLQVSYVLKSSGSKTIDFKNDVIAVNIIHPGQFTEIVPLLAPPDASLKYTNKSITLTTDRGTVTLKIRGSASVKKMGDIISIPGRKRCHVFEISSKEKLAYDINF